MFFERQALESLKIELVTFRAQVVRNMKRYLFSMVVVFRLAACARGKGCISYSWIRYLNWYANELIVNSDTETRLFFANECNLKNFLCTWSGPLSAASFVNPTMSLKNIVTAAKLSAETVLPIFRSSATDLARIYWALNCNVVYSHTRSTTGQFLTVYIN